MKDEDTSSPSRLCEPKLHHKLRHLSTVVGDLMHIGALGIYLLLSGNTLVELAEEGVFGEAPQSAHGWKAKLNWQMCRAYGRFVQCSVSLPIASGLLQLRLRIFHPMVVSRWRCTWLVCRWFLSQGRSLRLGKGVHLIYSFFLLGMLT